MNALAIYDTAGIDRREAGSALADWVKAGGHSLSSIVVGDPVLKPCLGCFACWLKTPGACVIVGDRGAEMLASFVAADLVVLIGETPYGCFAQPIKAAVDRWLPSLLPFFRIYRGEMHHEQRYARQARIVSIALGKASDAEERSYLELLSAFCDNAASPRPKRVLRWTGDGDSLAPWLEGEFAPYGEVSK